MRTYSRGFLARLVREHLTSLDLKLEAFVERGEPLTELDRAQLMEAAEARLLPVEDALRSRALERRRETLQAFLAPRIGRLHHYPPRPVRLPASYFRTPPPARPPSISIVTPSYQHGQFLERTIRSVFAQGYPALEYHVQDGGSTDETLDILERYGRDLAGVASEPDSGQADAINRAFASTTGEIMGWLNSDDLLLPGALRYVGRYFEEHPEVDVVYGNRLMIDENDYEIGAWILPPHDDHVLALADYVPQETLFWRRRAWERAGGHVAVEFSYALDWDLLLRLRDAGARMAHVPRFLGAFRVHPEQKTSAAHLVGLEEMALLRERANGRPVPLEEVLSVLRPYFLRHRVVHGWQRVLDRLPLATEVYAPRRRRVARVALTAAATDDEA